MIRKPLRNVVILGGGFGGLYTALHLEKALGHDPDVRVTLVNRENFFLFTPMLHEVASCDIDLTHIVSPIRKLLRKVQLFSGDVEAIDLPGRRVHVKHGDEGHPHELPYDQLVIALGAVTNFYGLPGLAERALTMKSLGDAIHLRNRSIQNLEQADFECCAPLRTPLLTTVVAGGGFAGVETVAAVNDFLREAIHFYPNLNARDLRMVLVHSGKTILPELGEELGCYAQAKLAERGVEIITEARVAGFDDFGVTLADGRRIRTSTLVWTAGTSPHPLVSSLPLPLERGRARVNAQLEVPEWPGVWALGDCAAVPDGATGRFHPPTAQHAIRQGACVADNVVAALRGGSRRAFHFTTIGQLAAIGKRAGVARILGHNFSGFLAWWLWRTIYLSKLPRLEKKLRVMLDWTLDLLFSKDLVQFETFRARALEGMVSSDDTSASPVSREASASSAHDQPLPIPTR